MSKFDASHIYSDGNVISSGWMIGVVVNTLYKVSKASLHFSPKSNGMYFWTKLEKELVILLKP